MYYIHMYIRVNVVYFLVLFDSISMVTQCFNYKIIIYSQCKASLGSCSKSPFDAWRRPCLQAAVFQSGQLAGRTGIDAMKFCWILVPVARLSLTFLGFWGKERQVGRFCLWKNLQHALVSMRHDLCVLGTCSIAFIRFITGRESSCQFCQDTQQESPRPFEPSPWWMWNNTACHKNVRCIRRYILCFDSRAVTLTDLNAYISIHKFITC